MKRLRQLCAALVLTVALSANAFAGKVNCPGITDEPPSEEPTATGEMQNDITDVLLIMLSLV
jgi:hypothetical protein